MRIRHIILLPGVCSLICVYQIISTDIPLLHFSAVGQFHHKLIPIPDKDRLLPIHGLAGTQALGVISKAYLVVLCKRLDELVFGIVVVDDVFVQPVVPQRDVDVDVGAVFFIAGDLIAVDGG